MAEKRRFLDIWIVESNTVYREVPYTVVADWVQQGRLLEDDMLRPSGTAEWYRLGASPEFQPYLPREEPARPQDQAEALEPVEIDVPWKRRHDEEEDDPDMIPLIDVSLVLLIFFMITTTTAGAVSAFMTPAAYYGLRTSNPDLLAIGIDCDENREPARYAIGLGDKPFDMEYEVTPQDRAAAGKGMRIPAGFLALLDQRLAQLDGPVEVVVKTNENLKDGYYVNMLVELERRRVKIKHKYDGVREKSQP